MLIRDEITSYIEDTLGLSPSHKTQYATEYNAYPTPFYIKSTQSDPVVIHPDWEAHLHSNPIKGVESKGHYYSSALLRFPKISPDREHCGLNVRILDIQALEALLVRVGVVDASPELADIALARSTLAGLPETERQALISARLGQGRFRDRLMSAWKSCCAVTGVDIQPLLRASHIKPWRVSDNNERLDPENGLLLVANLDAAFDVGLVSFDDNGTMLYSNKLGSAPYDALGIGIRPGTRLTRRPSTRQQAFLSYHRDAAGF